MKYLFEWTPNISVGNKKIDGQHQKLLGQVNTLISYIISGKNDEVVAEAISFLDKYIDEHLEYEEKYMTEHRYPDKDKHVKFHDDFIQYYKTFKKQLDAGIPKEDLAIEIEQYIGNWWLEHIGKEDKKYADYIRNDK